MEYGREFVDLGVPLVQLRHQLKGAMKASQGDHGQGLSKDSLYMTL